MFGLLTPAFLIGVAALSVPLIIHLIRRERHDAVEFPSLMFLSRIPQHTVKRRRIRNWWLFALRCLALLLLVGAFARPYIDRPNAGLAAVDTARELVILIDRSYSMGYGDRWQRALAAAREAVTALGPQDRATIIFFDASANAATQATADPTQLQLALDSARVGSGATRYAPALKLAQSILGASELPRREAVLISDFQRSGWDGASGAQLPTGAVLRPVHVGAGATSNLVVTNVTLQHARVSGRERVSTAVQLANRSATPARGVRVALDVDGRTVQTTQADVAANGTASVELQPLTLGDVAARATVTAGTDALAADNAFHFTLEPEPGLRVLVLEPAGRAASLYLRQALELAQDPPVTLTVRRDGVPGDAELARTDVVILNDVLPPDGDAGRRLAEWVRHGGGLVHALGDRTAAGWTATARGLAGAAPERVIDRIGGGGGRLGYIDYSHPIFELFRSPRGGGFTGARFYRYRPLPVSAAASPDTLAKTAVLARFDDGSVALLERQLGEGRLLVWTSTLDRYWSSFPLEPAYLPFIHQLVRYAAGHTPRRTWHTAGQVVDVTAGSEEALVVGTPAGKRIDVAAGNGLLTLDEQGIYEVRDAREPNTPPRLYAVNLDVTESDLTPLDPAELVSAVTVPGEAAGAAARISLTPEEQERRQRLWWYMLAVAFALLTAEAVFANRRSPRPA
jgi:hypothetical protein